MDVDKLHQDTMPQEQAKSDRISTEKRDESCDSNYDVSFYSTSVKKKAYYFTVSKVSLTLFLLKRQSVSILENYIHKSLLAFRF